MSAGALRPGFARAMRAMHWATAALLVGAYPAAWMIGYLSLAVRRRLGWSCCTAPLV